MTSQFQLVWLPLILSAFLLLLGFRILAWRRRKLRSFKDHPEGTGRVMVLGLSLMLLSGFSLFLGLFFIITG